MDDQHWQQLKALFNKALDLDADSLPAFLSSIDDEVLRKEVENMLSTHENSQILSIEGRLADPHDPLFPKPDSMIGQYIGKYRLVDVLGEGGMAEVFLGERADDAFTQKVAIKILRAGLRTPELIRRFRQERQLSARLNHSNIARLLDGGMTSDDRPYLVRIL